MNASVRRLFELIRYRGVSRVPRLYKISFQFCKLADSEHQKSHRQYAHYNHKKRVVCVATAIEDLRLEWKIGIVAHELGHAAAELLGLFEGHSEEDANRLGSAILESTIEFRGPERLEWASVPPWLKARLSWEEGPPSGKRS